MRNKSHFIDGMVAAVCTLLAILFLIACQQSQQPAASSAPSETKPATSDIFVVFEGPWAIAPDPKDANSVLAIAPKTKSHRLLAVVPANTELDAGVYDVSVPGQPSSSKPELDKGILHVTFDPQAVQRALDRRGDRYAIRLPRPEAYVAETRYPSRVGPTYPPEASTEQNYATAVALRYSVSSKTGFQLAGTPDVGGAFKPLLFELSTGTMRFTIDPLEVHLHDEDCHAHARTAFHDMTTLVGLALYIDFPESPADCHKTDPQGLRSQKAQLLESVPAPAGVSRPGENSGSVQTASIVPPFGRDLHFASRWISRQTEAAIYFFHSEGGACIVPIPVGG